MLLDLQVLSNIYILRDLLVSGRHRCPALGTQKVHLRGSEEYEAEQEVKQTAEQPGEQPGEQPEE